MSSHSQRHHRSLLTLRIVVDLVAILLALATAYVFRFEFGLLAFSDIEVVVISEHMGASGAWLACTMLALFFNRLYDEDTLFERSGERSRVARSILESTGVLALLIFLSQSFAISRSWFVFVTLGSLGYVVVGRSIAAKHIAQRRRGGHWRRPLVIVTRGETKFRVDPVEQDEGFFLAGHLPADGMLDATGTPPHQILRERFGPGAVLVLRTQEFTEEELWRVVLEAGEAGSSVFIQAAVRSVSRDRLTVRAIGGETMVKVAPPNLTGAKALQKRLLDLTVSLVGLVLLSPLLVVVALVIWRSSGRPILFVQERVGQDGKPFRMLKFRTMVRQDQEAPPSLTERNDPRRTKVGGVLRRLSLDELPQLWNVVAGQMSIVGPRPEQPSFVAELANTHPWYRYRHRIKPGITGWAQTHGLRGNTSITSRAEHDNWYIEHWSVALDLSIVMKTLSRMWSDRNAY